MMTIITFSQNVNNIWITYHHKSKTSNKMESLLSIMYDFPDFCMNNRQNCKSVCKRCYAYIQSSIRGKSIWPKLKHNTDVFSNSKISFNSKIESPLNVLRFSSYGELLNAQHFLNIILTARTNPHLHCAVWTKRPHLIKHMMHLIPCNLIMVWSASQLNSNTFIIPKHFTKSFYVYTDQSNLNAAKSIAISKGYNVIECSKQCKECLHCYTNHSQSIVMELLK